MCEECHVLQDQLLEVGWNNSQSTQRDVEKSLNCCGFHQVDPNAPCDAVSLFPGPCRTSACQDALMLSKLL